MAYSFTVNSHFTHFGTLGGTNFDLVVIGGGITGAGIALDAAQRGLSVALFEKADFASGTSSRSTKLIHGGLRYLKQLEIGLVREVGLERSIVHRMAPHLVIPEKMLLPLVEHGTFGRWATSLGLWVYDVLAGVEGDNRRVMLSREETLEQEPLLNPHGLIGSGFYAEYRTDDARLTIETLKKAVLLGAIAYNYCEVTDFVYGAGGRIAGVEIYNSLTATAATVSARYVVNACGPWVDVLRNKDRSLHGKHLHLTKGVHVVVAREKLPLRQAAYFDVPDGRMIFAIPRGKTTYIGTTDTDYTGDRENVHATAADSAYLLNAANATFPSAGLEAGDVLSSWAGLRPLIHEDGKSASELSRKDEIFESPSGLLSMAGGKLTGYRKMAERLVDLVMHRLHTAYGCDFVKCNTHTLTLQGGNFGSYHEVQQYRSRIARMLEHHIHDELYTSAYLVAAYGLQTDDILALYHRQPTDQPASLRLLTAELEYSFDHEMICRPADFVVQRTGRLYFDIRSLTHETISMVVHFFASRLGWDPTIIATETALLTQLKEKAGAVD